MLSIVVQCTNNYFSLKKSEHFKPDKSLINIVLFTCMSGGYAGQQSEGFAEIHLARQMVSISMQVTSEYQSPNSQMQFGCVFK